MKTGRLPPLLLSFVDIAIIILERKTFQSGIDCGGSGHGEHHEKKLSNN